MRYEQQAPYTEPKKEDETEKFASAQPAPPNEIVNDKAPSPELVVTNAAPVDVPEPVGQEMQAPAQPPA